MKNIIISLIFTIISFTCIAQSYKVIGNTYTSVSSKTKVEGKKTPYNYEDRNSETYTIYILEDGRCYTNRVSKTSGKEYRSYLKEDISKDIAKKMNIAYSYVKKSKKKQ